MPLIVKCKDCGYIIYYSTGMEGLEYFNEIVDSFKSCPNCGKKLNRSIGLKNIKISRVRPITIGIRD